MAAIGGAVHQVDDRADGWRRSSRCVTENHCVEVRGIGGFIDVRNSRRPADRLRLDSHSWNLLMGDLKAGAFDSR
jgi:hypothetical protein